MTDDEGGNGDACEDDPCLPAETGDSTTDEEQFRLGAILGVLSHPMRRRVLVQLDSRGSELSLDELASHIGEPYTIIDPLQRSQNQERNRERDLELQLYHVHVPKLVQEGLVTFDQSDMTVSITAEGEEALRRLF
jgi:DNA-binding transcriptional ArsR family regulator